MSSIDILHTPSNSAWMEHALCAERHCWDLMHPDTAQYEDPVTLEALSVCQSCPVVSQCRQWGDMHGEVDEEGEPMPLRSLFGILGGETPARRYARRMAAKSSGTDFKGNLGDRSLSLATL